MVWEKYMKYVIYLGEMVLGTEEYIKYIIYIGIGRKRLYGN